VQQACSLTQKASLVMVLSWISQWWMPDVSSGVRFGGCGVGRWPLASVVAGNPRDRFVFLDFLRFYLHSFHDNHFIPVCLLVSTYVASYNWILINKICGCS
jgi:hypothetical protein